MPYEEHCRKLFHGLDLAVEDLYLLEPHQVAYLRDRAPRRHLAAVLHAHPALRRHFLSKCPDAQGFLDQVTGEHGPAAGEEELARLGDSLVWEIADMVVYCKAPELYDQRSDRGWNFEEIFAFAPVEGKVVIDAGAGTGRVAFQAAPEARHVFAVEPNAGMRGFIRRKARDQNVGNLYAIDGFLDAIPLPDDTADVLFTSNAIGWHVESELREVERVVGKGGRIVHLCSADLGPDEEPLSGRLTGPPWHYACERKPQGGGTLWMFSKQAP